MTESTIIVGVDGSTPSLDAAEYAATEAIKRGRKLTLVHGYLNPYGYGAIGLTPYLPALPEPLADVEAMLHKAAETVRAAHPGLEVHSRLSAAGGAAALIDDSRNAELVVVGSRGLGGFAELLLGSVSSQVAAHAHCPVLVLRPNATPLRPDAPIVVGVDGSPGATRAVEWAFAEAAIRGVELRVIHVYWARALANLRHLDEPPGASAEKDARLVLAEAVDGLREKYPEVSVVTSAVRDLNVERAMLDAAQTASLVVVGARGRGGFAGLLLGSVSQALVHHADCPIAVVH